MVKLKKTLNLLPDFDGDSLQEQEYQDQLLEKAKELLGEEKIPVYHNSCLYCGGLASTPPPDIKTLALNKSYSLHRMYCIDCGAMYSIQ